MLRGLGLKAKFCGLGFDVHGLVLGLVVFSLGLGMCGVSIEKK